jgi:hypothetical protein
MKTKDELLAEFDGLFSNPDTTPEQKSHVAELHTVARTEHGPLKWDNEDGNWGEDTPPPDSAKADRMVEMISNSCEQIRKQTPRADTYFYKELKGYFLHLFDSTLMTDEDRRSFLDDKYCHNYDNAYCAHRLHLFRMQQSAKMKLRNMERDLAAYLKLPKGGQPLHDDEQIEIHNIYQWMVSQTQFDSMKWLQLPRSYNRRQIFYELMVRFFIETWQTATLVTQEQLQKWFCNNQNGWKVMLEKDVIFIVLDDTTPLTFWDFLLDHLQPLCASRSVIFISTQTAAIALPKELRAEYRRCAMPMVDPNSKIDKSTYQFEYDAPPLKGN